MASSSSTTAMKPLIRAKASVTSKMEYLRLGHASPSGFPAGIRDIKQRESLTQVLLSGLSKDNLSFIRNEFARLKKLASPEYQEDWDCTVRCLIELCSFIEGHYHGSMIGVLLLTGNDRAVALVKELGNYTDEEFLDAKLFATFGTQSPEKGTNCHAIGLSVPGKSNQNRKALMSYAIENAQFNFIERLLDETKYEPEEWSRAVYRFAAKYITKINGYWGTLIEHGVYGLINSPRDPRIFTTLKRIIGNSKDFESLVQVAVQCGSLIPGCLNKIEKSPMRIVIENGLSPDDLKQLEEAGGYEPAVFAMKVKEKQFYMSEEKAIVKNGYSGSELQHALFTCDQLVLNELHQKSGYTTGEEFVVEAVKEALSSPWIEQKREGGARNKQTNDMILEIMLSPDMSRILERIKQSLIFIVSKDQSKTGSEHEAWVQAWLDKKIQRHLFMDRERSDLMENLIQNPMQDAIWLNDKSLVDRIDDMYASSSRELLVNKLQTMMTEVFQDIIQNSPEKTIEDIKREFLVKFEQGLQNKMQNFLNAEVLEDLKRIVQRILQEMTAQDSKAIREIVQHDDILEYFKNLRLPSRASGQACKLNHTSTYSDMKIAPSLIQIALLKQDEKTLVFCRDSLEMGLTCIREEIEQFWSIPSLEQFRQKLTLPQIEFFIKAGKYTKEEFLKIPRASALISSLVNAREGFQQGLFRLPSPDLNSSTTHLYPGGSPANVC